MELKVAVVIPAYNVELYIEQAIQSALKQTEVTEVIVVDDGSTDHTFKTIQSIVDERVKLFQHENGVNKGRGASRNLGIIKATAPCIAFLDADDFYLENRFTKDAEILQDRSIDGCYNAVGFHFYRAPKEEEKQHYKISTLSHPVPPEDLFENIVTSKLGYLHLNGLTFKKEVFDQVGLMNVDLRVTQDTDIIFKIAMKCALKASSIENPVALRGVHETNVFYQNDLYKEYTPLMYDSLFSWAIKNDISLQMKDQLMNSLWVYRFKQSDSLLKHTAYWLRFFLKFPSLSLYNFPIKYFPLVRKRKELFSFLYK
ncbi:probable glycosyl transferase [Nonlabens ulvanivorans]|nr:glycosyltransferase family A protein [Nonlabens ulvanivorans]GAK93158.1 probable glycosyl transferase [Nonlabens ulvanivorans]